MNRKQALERARQGFRALADIQVRNAMEHAANKTPVITGIRVRALYTDDAGAG